MRGVAAVVVVVVAAAHEVEKPSSRSYGRQHARAQQKLRRSQSVSQGGKIVQARAVRLVPLAAAFQSQVSSTAAPTATVASGGRYSRNERMMPSAFLRAQHTSRAAPRSARATLRRGAAPPPWAPRSSTAGFRGWPGTAGGISLRTCTGLLLLLVLLLLWLLLMMMQLMLLLLMTLLLLLLLFGRPTTPYGVLLDSHASLQEVVERAQQQIRKLRGWAATTHIEEAGACASHTEQTRRGKGGGGRDKRETDQMCGASPRISVVILRE